jgi:hypothetical protein
MPNDIVMSKAFGPTDSVADTVTTIGSAYQFPQYDMTVKRILIGYGNVVNAKESAGVVIVQVPSQVGSPYVFAFGGGAGGATNSNNTVAELIDCEIPVPKNVQVTVKVITSEAFKDVTVSLSCVAGLGKPHQILCAGGAGQDTTADTLLALSLNAKLEAIGVTGLTPYQNDIVRRIRISGSGVVDGKAASGILYLTVKGYPLPLEFAFGLGSGGSTTSSSSWATEIKDLNIRIAANSTVGVSVITAEVLLSATVTLHCD